MTPGHAYYYQNKTGAARFIVLAGDVQNNNSYGLVDILTVPGNSLTAENKALSWRDSRNIPIATAVGPQLVAQGFMGGNFSTSDLVVDQVVGGSARVTADGLTWGGTMTQLVPGHAYYILNRVHPNNAWTYNYATGLPDAAAAAVSAPMPSAPAITKAPMNTSKETVKTSSVKSGSTAKKATSTK
jgi:hypothetical protein